MKYKRQLRSGSDFWRGGAGRIRFYFKAKKTKNGLSMVVWLWPVFFTRFLLRAVALEPFRRTKASPLVGIPLERVECRSIYWPCWAALNDGPDYADECQHQHHTSLAQHQRQIIKHAVTAVAAAAAAAAAATTPTSHFSLRSSNVFLRSRWALDRFRSVAMASFLDCSRYFF